MLDLSAIEYRVLLVRENGEKWNITRLATEISWEENEGELAARLTAQFANEEVLDGWRLSLYAKLGCYIIVQALMAGMWVEVMRGVIIDWETNDFNFRVTCYDELFYLQQSEDNRYYSSGARTKSAITGILDEWKIPLGDYKGPDVSHGKMLYKNERLSDILLKILADAQKKSKEKYILRAQDGKVHVLPLGSNEDIYVFHERQNVISARDKVSTANLVTRVKVLGKQKDNKRAKIQATLNGNLEYGLRQKIVQRSGDESLADAKASAQEILDEYGSPKREISIQCVDLPIIRKGDKVRIITRGIGEFHYVKSVRHNAMGGTMYMDVEEIREE